jgi:uncharacterized membrane-anchored protein
MGRMPTTESRPTRLKRSIRCAPLGWLLDHQNRRNGAAIFGAGLVIVDLLWLWPRVLRTALFWVAFVLARPFGGLLDKPIAEGGVHFSRFYASGILVAVIGGCIMLIPQRAARRAPSAQCLGVPASVL